MYKRIFCLASFILCAGLGFAQQGVDRLPEVATQNLMLARSSPTYRVTPGDVYTLFFLMAGNPISYTIVVDTAYRIRVANMGIVNGAGRTFAQVRAEVETLVSRNHPLSGPQLVLTQPAVFRVFVDGEVYVTREHTAWGLSRLSSLVEEIDRAERMARVDRTTGTDRGIVTGRATGATGGGTTDRATEADRVIVADRTTENLTRFASIRDISIRSANGQTQVFDLFRFQRLGDQTQNPYLRPDDVITFNRVSRLVTVEGEVERPGTYQLLEGENIRELIEFYGNGFTSLADPTRIEMLRRVNSDDVSGDRIFLTGSDLENNFALENYDIISVPPTSQLMPVMFVEGAVDIDMSEELVTTNRLVIRFHVGETYAAMVRRNIDWFSAISDTENAYIIRLNGEIIHINLNNALFDATYRGDLLIQAHDTLIIPFRQFFVTVAGAVQNPGRFPFIPDRGWEYYIALAGGFAAGRNAFDRIDITDINGRRLRRTEAITPETVITARTNHPMHFLGHYIAPVLAVVSTIISIVLITR